MVKRFDPDDPERMNYPAGEPMNDPLIREPRSGLGAVGMLVGLAFALLIGFVFWNMSERSNTTASNTSPGATTGSSTTPPPAPPADVGKTDQK